MTLGALAAAVVLGSTGQDNQNSRRHLFGYLMDYTTVLTGDRGGSMERDVVIARTKPQWDAMRAKLGVSDEKDAEFSKLHGPLGAIDWGREQIVFARAGQRSTGGYTASVYKLTKIGQSDSWRIEILITPPTKDTMSIEMLTNPYVVFRMRRVYGHPELQIREAKPG